MHRHTHTQGRFRESISALQSGLLVDSNNAGQIKEKSDTEACMRRAESAKELLSQVGGRAYCYDMLWCCCAAKVCVHGWLVQSFFLYFFMSIWMNRFQWCCRRFCFLFFVFMECTNRRLS